MSTSAKRKKPHDELRRPYAGALMEKAEALAARYQLVLWQEEGHWYGRGLELPLCMGDGATIAACARMTRRSIVLGVASMIEEGREAPAPAVSKERRAG